MQNHTHYDTVILLYNNNSIYLEYTMKVNLKGLFNPETNYGLAEVIITLYGGARLTSIQKLMEKKSELEQNLMHAAKNELDLNQVIQTTINFIVPLCIDFNEIIDKKTNLHLDVAKYNETYNRYGKNLGNWVIGQLVNSKKYRSKIIDALARFVSSKPAFSAAYPGSSYEDIAAEIDNTIDIFNNRQINLDRFYPAFDDYFDRNEIEQIMQGFDLTIIGTIAPPIIRASTSPDLMGSPRSGSMSPVTALLQYFKTPKGGEAQPTVRKILSFQGLRPVRSFSTINALENNRAENSDTATSRVTFRTGRAFKPYS